MNIIIIGFSGHSYVVIDCLKSQKHTISMYCDIEQKKEKDYKLKFIGHETSQKALEVIKNNNFFVSIGENKLRKNIYCELKEVVNYHPINAIHKQSIVSPRAEIGNGVLISPGAIINSHAKIGNGVICNTSSIIEHEVIIDDFAHISPGATICGNVIVGENTFVGANSIIKEGVNIGRNVTIGAGTVVISDIKDGATFVGNPARPIKL